MADRPLIHIDQRDADVFMARLVIGPGWKWSYFHENFPLRWRATSQWKTRGVFSEDKYRSWADENGNYSE